MSLASISYRSISIFVLFGFLLLSTACQKEVVTPEGFDLAELPYDNLSDYGFFEGALKDMNPSAFILPYDLHTPLFSDYSLKARFMYVPSDASADYKEGVMHDFPEGSIIIKTFYYELDQTDPNSEKDILETRLLIHKKDGWEPASYIWNDSQTDAHFTVVGEQRPMSWIDENGETKTSNYLIPNKNECKGCHSLDGKFVPLGPKARNLNNTYSYSDGDFNQLDKWVAKGFLAGAPSASAAPFAPKWDDPSTGSLDLRARTYLDVNCAHCHNPNGPGDNSGLFLNADNTDLQSLGVCKSPVAAGQGSFGLPHAILPGEPDNSFLVLRMESVDPDKMMPELARSIVHEEGVELIREWIAAMEGSCD